MSANRAKYDCAHCGKRNAPMACLKCETAYCKATCQRDNWQYHKTYICLNAKRGSKKREYLVPSTMTAAGEEIIYVPGFPNGCLCKHSGCTDGGPVSCSGLMGGIMSFMGVLRMPTGEHLKLDDPRDFTVRGRADTKNEKYRGHFMTHDELMSEESHCDDDEGYFHEERNMRSIGSLLVDYRGRKKDSDVSNTMYPFHSRLKPPYSKSKPPKIRADDVVTVVASGELKLSEDFAIAPKDIVQVYVISLTASGIVTGVIETSVENYWVHFPHHRVRQLVKRGIHWK